MAESRFNPRIPSGNTRGLLARIYDPSFQINEEEEEADSTGSSIDEEKADPTDTSLQIVREEEVIPEIPNPPALEIELADYQKTDWGTRPRWNAFKERWTGPLKGKLDPMYKHDLHLKMIASYDYHRGTVLPRAEGFTPCRTEIVNAHSNNLIPIQRLWDATSGLEFDPTGEFLASVNRVGCLTVQRFQTLRYYSDHIVRKTGGLLISSKSIELVVVQVADFGAFKVQNARPTQLKMDCNVATSVACTSMLLGEVLIYGLASFSSDPLTVLRLNRGTRITDVAFNGSDDSRLYGSGLNGIVNVWDPRTSYLPCLELVTHELVHDILSLKSIQLHQDSQKVFGGDHSGNVFMWDIRNPSIPAGVWRLRDLLVTIGYVQSIFSWVGLAFWTLKAPKSATCTTTTSIDYMEEISKPPVFGTM
ncbi:unnamed protein product [Linum tenue]|uniref:Uncharacterized protein n=1 Tax=Linum tenue TaxID=586396 RepID=A0AAV0JRX9_9ROSI|nr:unnamed protein product [Linum tenue]